ncbi:MAG: hypothetical protein R3D27_13980 [Hyphomicrobiaceae bacterium]
MPTKPKAPTPKASTAGPNGKQPTSFLYGPWCTNVDSGPSLSEDDQERVVRAILALATVR